MKRIVLSAMMLTAMMTMSAKDVKTLVVTTEPQMHCENCEKKIKNNLRFEKGVKKIDTNVEKQTVTIQYDGEKTTEANIIKGFTKFGYKASKVKTEEKKK